MAARQKKFVEPNQITGSLPPFSPCVLRLDENQLWKWLICGPFVTKRGAFHKYRAYDTRAGNDERANDVSRSYFLRGIYFKNTFFGALT